MHRFTLVLALVLALDSRAADKPKSSDAPKPTKSDGAIALFDGKSLAGWTNSDFAANGGGSVDTGFKGGPVIIVEQGEVLSGITYTNPVPRADYELSLDAIKLSGSDFFCGLTFPVKDKHATLVLGGWGGGVVGISSIDGSDASENETTKYMKFDKNVWYHVRVRVTANKIEAWLDDEKIADVETAGKRIEMRPGEIESAVPLSLSTYQTRAAYRNLMLKKLSATK
ncbi:MAG TPA: DUF1080 domain-containing protein [Verrucomicrobiae bacterium]